MEQKPEHLQQLRMCSGTGSVFLCNKLLLPHLLLAMTTFLFRCCPLLLLSCLPLLGRGQAVGVGTTSPSDKAALEVHSPGGNTGLLIPRLTATQRSSIASPPQGLLVYQTDGSAGGGPQTGFWYYAGSPTGWTFLSSAADNLGNHTATQNLSLGANALTGTGANLGSAVGVGVTAAGGLNLAQNTAGNNLYLGYEAGAAITTGASNHFVGFRSGASTTTGGNNYFSGTLSGYANETGSQNVFVGFPSGLVNSSGVENQFSGYHSERNNAADSYTLSLRYQSVRGRASVDSE